MPDNTPTDNKIPYGYCQCGCGQKAQISKRNRPEWGHVKGEPVQFIRGHNAARLTEERFWEKVDRRTNGSCWEWLGAKASNGYGRFFAYGSDVMAHRFSYEYHNGAIPDGLLVCHSCDNPPCVNPNHLWLGTQGDNMDDKKRKGRNSCEKFTSKQVSQLRKQHFQLGVGVVKLSRRHNVHRSTMRRLLHKITYQDV